VSWQATEQVLLKQHQIATVTITPLSPTVLGALLMFTAWITWE